MDNRKHMGKNKEGAIYKGSPNFSEMGDSYLEFIEEIKKEVRKQRVSVVMNANSSMIKFYWNMGRAILEKQEEEGWGAKIIDRMAKDLKAAFPEMSGFSPRNIRYMRKFAQCWSDYEILQRAVAKIPWRTNITLMDKLKTPEERMWYAEKTIENGWSKAVLELQIQNRLIERIGKTVNNFPSALPPLDSDMANQVFKDPYLFYHLKLRCYVVIELKACDFEPGFVSQLNMYQNAVNDLLCHSDDKPTIGLLLVKGKNKTVVEYSLSGYQNPIGVAEWQNQITQSLPEELQSSLPSIEEIEKELQ